MEENILEKIAICLVNPEGRGNIGSVARAMKNMGLSRLILVKGVDPDCNETRQMASGAYDLVEKAVVADTLKEAIAPYQIVAGTSRRRGKSRSPTHYVAEFPDYLFPLLAANECVIVFGQERAGLTNEELDLCNSRIYIPTNSAHGSLNLAQAVLLVAYEIYRNAEKPNPPSDRVLATSQELEGMFGHMEAMLSEVGFLNPENPSWIMRAFRNIFGRAGLNHREVKIIRGSYSDIEWYFNHILDVGKRDRKPASRRRR